MTIAGWNAADFAATCDTAAGYTGDTVTVATCDQTADAAYVVTGCTLTDCIAPATPTGYTITANPTAMTFSSWDNTGFTATCDASTGYTGTPAAATCSAVGGEYVLSGCVQTDCIAP